MSRDIVDLISLTSGLDIHDACSVPFDPLARLMESPLETSGDSSAPHTFNILKS